MIISHCSEATSPSVPDVTPAGCLALPLPRLIRTAKDGQVTGDRAEPGGALN